MALFTASWSPASNALAQAQVRGRVLPVEEMVGKSDVIGVATVQTVSSRRDDKTGLICTDFALSFSEVWKGSVSGSLILWKAGGRLGDRATGVAGQDYALQVGEQVVVFCHPSSAGNFVAIGLRQGLYRIGAAPDRPLFRISEYPESAGKTSSLSLRMLKDEVWRSLGRPIDARPVPKAVPVEENPGKAGIEVPSGSLPTTPPAQGRPELPTLPSFRLWAGLVVFALVLTVAIGFVISKRKASTGKP